MLSIKSLLSLSIALLILSVVLLFLFKKLRKSKLVNIFFIFSCILLFVSMFEIVYCAFFFQWGYPAGPELTNGDWLSFLGGYLEFSGALVMAWLVYRQSETINKLAMQEYRIGVKAIPDKIELKEYLEEDQSHVFCTYMDKGVPILEEYKLAKKYVSSSEARIIDLRMDIIATYASIPQDKAN